MMATDRSFPLDIVAVALMIPVGFLNLFLVIGSDAALQTLGVQFLVMMAVGLLLGLAIQDGRILDAATSPAELLGILGYGVFTAALMVIVQVVAMLLVGSSGLVGASVVDLVYPVAVGVSEELAFGYGLTLLLYRVSRSTLFASAGRAAGFAVFHLWTGQSIMSLWQLAASGFVLSLMFLVTRRISVAMLGHSLFDAMLLLGG